MANDTEASSPSSGDESQLMVLVFTDVEGSVTLQNPPPDGVGESQYREAFAHHVLDVQQILAQHGGKVEREAGDSLLLTFDRPSDAVTAALKIQETLRSPQWRWPWFKVRIGVHYGQMNKAPIGGKVDFTLMGMPANFCGRLLAGAHGGQILISRAVFDDAYQHVREHPALAKGINTALKWWRHGRYRFYGFMEPVDLYEVARRDVPSGQTIKESEKVVRVLPRGMRRTAVLALAAIVLLWVLQWVGAMQRLEAILYDEFRKRTRAEIAEAPSHVTVIAHTDRDVEAGMVPPLSDTQLANVIDAVLKLNPRVVGVDFLRSGYTDPALTDLLARDDRIVMIYTFPSDLGGGVPPPAVLNEPHYYELGGQLGFASFPEDSTPTGVRRAVLVVTMRSPAAVAGAARKGDPSVSLSDGAANDSTGFSLALQSAFRYLSELDPPIVPQDSSRFVGGPFDFERLRSGDSFYDAINDQGHQILLDLHTGIIPQYSFTDVLTGQVQEDMIRDRVVILGAINQQVQDLHPSPISALMPGVELHAHATDQIIRAATGLRHGTRHITRNEEYLMAIGCAILGLCVGLLSVHRRTTMTLGVLLIVGWVAVLWWMTHSLIYIPQILPTMHLALAVVLGGTLIRYRRARRPVAIR